jgi:HlyD family secretion protein
MIQRLLILIGIAAALLLALVLSQRRQEPRKVSGFVEADEIRLGSRVGGRVKSVAVDEGQRVRKGDVLVELEAYDLHERLAEASSLAAQKTALYEQRLGGYRAEEIAQAKARRDQLASQLAKLKHGPRAQEITAASAELELARSELQLAELKLARTEDLHQTGAATQEALDEATTQRKVAQARVTAREQQSALLREGTRTEDLQQAEAQLEEAEQAWQLMRNGYEPKELEQARAAMDAARAAQAAIEQQLAELKIVAPVEAAVEALELQPGDLIAADAPAVSLLDLSHLWIRAYVPENQLNLSLGQPVSVTVDSFPGRRFAGRLSFIARQAEFTPGNVQTPEERSKQVFRIKVELLDGGDALRPGMAADVWLDDPGAAP